MSAARTRAASQVSFKFKVQNEDVAAKIRQSGIKIKLNSGSFKLYQVAAKIVEKQTTPSTPSTGGGNETVLTYENQWGQLVISNGQFANVKTGDEIRIYYSAITNQWYWQIQTWDGSNSGYNYKITAWGSNLINTKNEFKTDDYFFIPIDDENSFATMLKEKGIRIQCDNITVSSIKLCSK